MDLTTDEILAATRRLEGVLVRTPVVELAFDRWGGFLPDCRSLSVKLELFQQAGSFKARGGYLGMTSLTEAEKAVGVVAASGGNHALAVAWAARAAGVDILITMPRATDPVRIEGCRAMGARVELYDDVAEAFAAMTDAANSGRILMHPFEAAHMVLGSATCGYEYLVQSPNIDTFVIPVGGGGMISGMAAAIKLFRPNATVIGVEPTGADSITRSLTAGHPVTLDKVDTIADSLGAPYALPMTFDLVLRYVDEVVQITDDQMRTAMQAYKDALHLMAEPACAASLAAICGPLKDRLAGKNVGIVACGSNISLARYQKLLAAF